MANLSSAARGVMAGIRNRHYDPNQPRDRTGKWTDGGADEFPPAPQGITDLYNRMKNEGLTRSQMIARAQAEGHPDAEKHITNLMRQTAREGRRALKKAGIERIIKHRKKGVVEQIQKKVGGDGVMDEARKLHASGTHQLRIEERVAFMLQEREKTALRVVKMEHGMTQAEKMFVVDMDGVPLHYAEGSAGTRKIASVLITKSAMTPFPPELTRHTKEIYIPTLRNGGDAHWEKLFKIPGFTAAATGGHGSVVYYNGGGSASSAWTTLAHEMGHNLSSGVYGDGDPGSTSAIGKLYDAWKSRMPGSEPPPSNYGRNNRAEAFAESVAAYFADLSMKDGYRPLTPRYRAAVEEALRYSKETAGRPVKWSHADKRFIAVPKGRRIKGTRGTISIVYENGKPRIRRTG